MTKEALQKLPGKQKSTQEIKSPSGKSEKPHKEYGGPKGKEPTRYGDWEKNGRCIDF